MKRVVIVALMASLFGLPILGCHHNDNNEKEVKMKVDTEGSTKSVKIDHN